MKGHVLFVSYFFPPDTSPGSTRVTGLVRHLAAADWRVSVLTTSNLAVGRSDASSLDRIPDGVDVHRTGSVELYQTIHRAASRGSEIAEESDARPARNESEKKKKRLSPFVVFKKTVKWLIYPFYMLTRFPDKQVGWLEPLLRNGRRLIRNGNIDVVVSSSPPHSSQWGMYLLRIFFNYKWIVDFRDPWTAPIRHARNPVSVFLQRAMERRVLRSCDRIVVNTPGNREALLAAFPGVESSKVSVVTNGFDTEREYDEALESPDYIDCDMIYVGEIYKGMLDTFLDALVRLREREPEAVPKINVFGTIHAREYKKIEARGLEENIVYRGFVSAGQSIRIMKEAPSLLLLLPHNERWKTCVPSKVYPYMFSEKPVLAVAPEGDSSRMLESSGTGILIDSADAGEIARGIGAFVRDLRAGNLSVRPDRAYVNGFAVNALAAQFDGMMQQLIQSRSRS
jgi:glycosyltransferase involved in cell wall biosynthesis